MFGASTTSSISMPRSFASALCSSAESTRTARWLRSGRSGSPGSPAWNSTYAPPTSTRGAVARRGAKPSGSYSPAAAPGRARERDVVEVVARRRSRASTRHELAAPSPQTSKYASPVAAARAAGAAERARPDAARRASAALARALGVEERQLAAARVGAEQRELVGPVDDVHPEVRVANSAMRSRSATQSATWSSVVGSMSEDTRASQPLLPPVDRPLELLLRHLRAALDAHPLASL